MWPYMGGVNVTILGDLDEVGVVHLLKLLTSFCLFTLFQVNKPQLQVACTQHRTVLPTIQSTDWYHYTMNITHYVQLQCMDVHTQGWAHTCRNPVAV